MSRLLHHIAKITGQLQFAGTIHHIDFHFQGISAYGCSGKSGYDTDLILSGNGIRLELAYTQEAFHILLRFDMLCLCMFFRFAPLAIPDV